MFSIYLANFLDSLVKYSCFKMLSPSSSVSKNYLSLFLDYSIPLSYLLIFTPVLLCYNDCSSMIRFIFLSGRATHPNLHVYSFAKFSWLMSYNYSSRWMLESFSQIFPNPNAIKLYNWWWKNNHIIISIFLSKNKACFHLFVSYFMCLGKIL